MYGCPYVTLRKANVANQVGKREKGMTGGRTLFPLNRGEKPLRDFWGKVTA